VRFMRSATHLLPIMQESPLPQVSYQSKEVVYNILFQATAETLRTIAADPKHLGAQRSASSPSCTVGVLAHTASGHACTAHVIPNGTYRFLDEEEPGRMHAAVS
jgi:hypothetical protein